MALVSGDSTIVRDLTQRVRRHMSRSSLGHTAKAPRILRLFLACLFALAASNAAVSDEPPYFGTVYIDQDWLTPADPTLFLDSAYVGLETFTWFDFRTKQWSDSTAYTYTLRYEEDISITASIHTELPQGEIAQYLDDYAIALGRVPAKVLSGLGELQFVPEAEDGQGFKGNGSTDPTHVVVYEDQPKTELDKLLSNGWLEEVLIHELGHAVLDQRQESAEWIAAKTADACYISTYALENPVHEDVAESLMPYLMLTLLPERVSEIDKSKINQCIAARKTVFDRWFKEAEKAQYSWAPWLTHEEDELASGLPVWLLYEATQK